MSDCLFVNKLLVVAKEKCEDCVSSRDQSNSQMIFFIIIIFFNLWPTSCHKYANPFGASSFLRLFPELVCNPWKARSFLVDEIKEKYKPAGARHS